MLMPLEEGRPLIFKLELLDQLLVSSTTLSGLVCSPLPSLDSKYLSKISLSLMELHILLLDQFQVFDAVDPCSPDVLFVFFNKVVHASDHVLFFDLLTESFKFIICLVQLAIVISKVIFNFGQSKLLPLVKAVIQVDFGRLE